MSSFEIFLSSLLNAQSGANIGSHGWTIYLCTLAGLLVVTGLVIYLADKPMHITHPRVKPAYTLALVIVVLGISGFASIAWLLASSRQMDLFDQALSASAGMHLELSLLRVFATVTHLGDTLTFTVLCIAITLALLVKKHYPLAIFTVVAIGGNSTLNRTLKALFERMRPIHEHGLVRADGWSFPSGHSSGSVVVYGVIAYILLTLLTRNRPASQSNLAIRLVIVMVAVAIAFTVGCSRIFLQVHYASDVMAGFFSGSVWLCLCLMGYIQWVHQLAPDPTNKVLPSTQLFKPDIPNPSL